MKTEKLLIIERNIGQNISFDLYIVHRHTVTFKIENIQFNEHSNRAVRKPPLDCL